jgi:nucleotide-binding universal stress UspA family protein
MNILLAADGSRFTKKALAFLVANEQFSGPDNQVLVLNVQPALPPHVTRQLGKTTVTEYYQENAEKVLQPIRRFLDRHGIAYRAEWASGTAHQEIVAAATKAKSQLIVMGTHGHGLAGRIVMGSVAQRVVAESPVPVLLVK